METLQFSGEIKSLSTTLGDSSQIKNIAVVGGGENNVVGTRLLDSTVTGGIDVQHGGGDGGTTVLRFDGSAVRDLISVSQGEVLNVVANNSTLGGIDFSTDTSTSDFNLSSLNDLTIKGAVHVSTGTGSDSVTFQVLGGGTVHKGMVFDLGDGTNEFTGTVRGFSTKNLTLTGGTGNDSIDLNGDGSLGAINLPFGAGSNFATFFANSGVFTARSFNLASSSAGGDALMLARMQVQGKFNAQLGDGNSNVLIDDSTIGGPLTINTAGGSDTVRLDAGDLPASLVLAKATVIDLGDDGDILVLGGNGTTNLLITKSTLKADGGTGDNDLTNGPGNIFAKDPVFDNFEAP